MSRNVNNVNVNIAQCKPTTITHLNEYLVTVAVVASYRAVGARLKTLGQRKWHTATRGYFKNKT